MKCDSQASFLARTLASACLGHKPKAKVTIALIRPSIRIELASDTPIFHHLYRYSDMEKGLIRSQTLDLLEVGLVECSHGEYASAIVMLVKKDVHGNYTDRRMCGDYHPIN